MKSRLIILSLVSLALTIGQGCGKIEKRCNPLDPNGECYQSPQATLIFPGNGDTLSNENEMTFSWQGNNPHCQYSYKLGYETTYDNEPELGWSNWTEVTEVAFSGLDEEAYIFGVKARYPSGDPQDVPSTASFYVNVFPSFSLLIKPCSTSVSLNEEIAIQITVKGIENVMAAKFALSFSNNLLEIVEPGVTEGALLRENGGEVVFLHSANNSLGEVEIDLAVAGGEPPGITGSGTLAIITFRPKMAGVATISFDSYDLRDMNNNSIQIARTRNGRVSVE